ncbi:flavin reductase [Microlunatus ginsengisoli]|uniref:NADH-FMN oxidoreductase RutF, flavin reductase (DIM6/NTAB) family n=1 Tax=Microlunatus ginsengisoli TaxID=363863 RepID=A0ABP6ZBN1_9ACTN
MSDSGAFRQAAGQFASGVTVVTTHAAAGMYGVTASSFASLSLNPLLVSVSINRSSPLLGFVREAGSYAVSVLSSGQQPTADYFARRGRVPEPAGFREVPTSAIETGAPVVDGALSWFDCAVEDILPGGDHEILVGRVVAAGGRAGEPLVYWAGGYRELSANEQEGSGARAADRLSNAADGLAVALHLLGVGVEEMLDAQRGVEPALAALAAVRGTPADWDRLDDLVRRSERLVDKPDEFNRLALGFHGAIADIADNRVLRATLSGLGLVQSGHYRDRGSPASARAAVAAHRSLLGVLRDGDPDAARAAMESHLAAVRGQLQVG